MAFRPVITVVRGDLLEQDVEVIVNSWNKNFIPWWLLLPQGVSGHLKKKAGYKPFRELSKKGLLTSGAAVLTGSGRLDYKAIIHVAALNCLWMSNKKIVKKSVRNALDLALINGYESVAFPLIGSGTGGLSKTISLELIKNEAAKHAFNGSIKIVLYENARTKSR